MGTAPQFVATPKLGVHTIVNADSTNLVDVFTAGANGSRIDQIFAVHDDATAAVLVKLWIHDGTAAHLLGIISMAAATAGTPHVEGDYLQAAPWVGLDPCLILPTGHKIQASLNAAITATENCSVYAIGGDF